MSIFYLPDLGEGLSEAEIVAWHVAEGELVAREQLLVSVETAKAVVEVPSPEAGRIVKLYAAVGEVVPTGAPLVEFASAEAAQPSAKTAPEKPADAGSVVGVLPQDTGESRESFVIGRHRHTEARLQRTAQKPRLPRERLAEAEPATAESAAPAFEGEPLHGLRRHMAQAMAKSHREVALVTLHDEARIRWKDEDKPVLRLIQALAYAAAEEPALNAWYDDTHQQRQLHSDVHMGIAVDTKDGLLVPVLRGVQKLDAAALERRLNKLKIAAVKRTLRPEDMQGATMTLSVFGSIGGRFATPLVSPPQVAILAAGRIYEGVVAKKKGGIKTASLLPLSLSVDHRAVTGGEAARFLAAVIRHLEDQANNT